jgi:hypothetical protein
MKNIVKKLASVVFVFGLLLSGGLSALAATPAYGGVTATNITSTTATLTNTFNPKGLNTNAWFEMQNNQGVKLGMQNIGSGNSNVTSYYYATNLTPGTTYYYRGVAENTTTEAGVTSGTTWGSWQSFTTLGNNNGGGTCTTGCNPCTTNCNPNPCTNCCTYNCNPTPTPTVNVTANPASITAGSSSVISWTSSNATYCSNNFGGNTGTSGSKVVYPNYTMTYTVTCTNSTGSASDSAVVYVTPIPDPDPVYTPTVNLVANPTSVAYGGNATLSWTSTNANSCYGTGGWTGTKNTNGSYTLSNLTTTKTYSITCTGPGGSAYDTVTVAVASMPDPDPVYTPTVNLTINDNSIPYNGNVILSWSSSNATYCTASNGWSGNKSTSGTETKYNLTSGKTYTITCTGNGGSASDSVYVAVEDNNQNINPNVTTNSPSGVGTNYATLNGTVSANGGSAVKAWFDWGTNSSMGNQTNQVNYGNANNTNYSYNLGGLQSNTTYYYRAVAQNENGQMVYGSQMSFTTSGNGGCTYNCYNNNTPSVTTYNPTEVYANSAVLNGYVETNGNYTVRWFEYGTSTNYLATQTNKLNQGISSGNFNQIVTGLQQNVTYYYRAVAQGNGQTVYGNVLTFSTTGFNNNTCVFGNCAPTAVTTLATNVDNNSARLNGLGLVNGNINTNGYFEYGTNANYLGQTTNNGYIGSSASSPFYSSLFNLSPNTTYYYRAVVSNQYGTSRGDIQSFRTRTAGIVGGTNTTNTTTTNTRIIYREVIPVTNVVTSTEVGVSKPSLVFLTINRDNETIGLGNEIEYTVNYKNVSAELLRDLVLRVVLPKELNFVDASRGVFSEENNTLVVNIENLYPQEEGSVFFRVKVARGSEVGKIIVTTANMVYTISSTNIQEEVFAYSKNTLANNGNVLGAASIFGGSFFPTTLVGWLLLILIILLIILALRMAYYNNRNKTVINHNYTASTDHNSSHH